MRGVNRYGIRIGIVAAVVLLGAAGCGGGNADFAAGNVNGVYTLDDLQSLDLSLEGGTWVGGFPPELAAAFVEPLPGEIEGIDPIECRDLGLIRNLVTTADSHSQDPVKFLGGIRVLDSEDPFDYEGFVFTVRVFDKRAEATAFLVAVRVAARACPNGYTMDLWNCEDCRTQDGAVGVAAVGGVSYSANTRWGGGRWVLVEERAVEEWSGDYGTTTDYSTYFFAYGNVVVAIESDFDSDAGGGAPFPLVSDDLDSLVQQIVDQLAE